MASLQPASNPFALLLNPAAVFAELERSERLNRLTSRVCRPVFFLASDTTATTVAQRRACGDC